MKKYIWLVAVFCVIAVTVFGCGRRGGRGATKDSMLVLAQVGNEVITLKDFNEKLANLPDNIRAIAENNKIEYLNNIILEMLLYKEGLKKGLDKDKEIQEFFKEAKKKIIIARLAKDEVEDKIKIKENEIRNYYEEHKENFKSPELYKASHILVTTLEEAVEIIDDLNTGASFDKLAESRSLDTTKDRGGDIGYFTTGQMVPDFEEACLKLEVGEISGPVKTQFGYHVIKLTDKKGPEAMKFDKVKPRIENILMTQKSRTLFDLLVTRLKTESNIVINNELIEPQEEIEEGAASD